MNLGFCDNLSRRPCSSPFPPVRRKLLPTGVSPVGGRSPTPHPGERRPAPGPCGGASPARAQRAAAPLSRAHRAPPHRPVDPAILSEPPPHRSGPARHARHFPLEPLRHFPPGRTGRIPGPRGEGPGGGAGPRNAPLSRLPAWVCSPGSHQQQTAQGGSLLPLYPSRQPLSIRVSLPAPATSVSVRAITRGKKIPVAASLPCRPRTPTSSNKEVGTQQ